MKPDSILIVKAIPPSKSWWLDPAFAKGDPIPQAELERMNKVWVNTGSHNRVVDTMYGKV